MTLLKNAKVLASGLGIGHTISQETPMTLLENCKRLDYSPDQPRDENGRFGEGGSGTSKATIHVEGRGTFARKETLKAAGYSWNAGRKSWSKEVDLPNAITHENADRLGDHPERIPLTPHIGAIAFKDVAITAVHTTQSGWNRSMQLHAGKESGVERQRLDPRDINDRARAETYASTDAPARGTRSEKEFNWRLKNDPDFL